MSRQINFTSYIPTALVGNNSPSKTLAAEAVTGLPISTGALPGIAFFLSESWANQLSASSVNGAPIMQCHAGWYMVMQVDSGATAANIAQGYIGAQKTLATGRTVVTDVSNELALGAMPVVFLNAVTPGNYTIVQIGGDANVYIKTGQSGSAGASVVYAAADTGKAGIESGTLTDTLYAGIVGMLEQTVTSPGLNRVNLAFPFNSIA